MTEQPAPVRLVARWDLDKTYLRTEFSTFGDLLARAFERADLKRSVPGATALLRELEQAGARIHFVSGSPRQLRGSLEAKLRLDGVRWDQLTLKPNLGNLLRFRFRALRDQLCYKLPALLAARVAEQAARPPGTNSEELLFGDDAEADALVYSVYADVLSGRLGAADVRRLLEAGGAYRDQLRGALASCRELQAAGGVRRILIHLDQQSPPSRFRVFGRRVAPFFNYFQAALVLVEDGVLPAAAALRVGADLAERHRFDDESLARSVLELARRGVVAAGLSERLSRARGDTGELPAAVDGALERLRRLPPPAVMPESPEPPSISDYLSWVERLRRDRHAPMTAGAAGGRS